MKTFIPKKYTATWIVALWMLTGQDLSAQKNYTFYSLNQAPQSHYLNPAFRPNANVFVSLPLGMQSFGVSNSGFHLKHLLHGRAQDDSLVFDPGKAIDKMANKNYLTFESQNEILGFGFAVKKNYFSFSATNRFQANVIYPRDLFRFAFEGNGKTYLGERASLDGFGVNLTSYVEYAIGFNREFTKKLTAGGRIKLLSGIANVNTKKSALGIHTDATTFDLTIDGSAAVYTSGVKPFYDTLTSDDYNPVKNAFSFKNSGFAIDLGAQYALTEKISLSASLLDLGTIKWKTDNANFVSNNVNYRFEGVDLNQYLQDSTTNFLDQLKDTLENVFSRDENAASYRTGLYTRFYLGGTYKLTDKFFVGATLYNEFIKSRYRPGLILSGNVKLSNWLAATVNYSAYARSYGNIGLGFSIKGGPVQFYVVSDNVLAFMFPQTSRNFHLSTGLSLLFGNPDKNKDTKAKYD